MQVTRHDGAMLIYNFAVVLSGGYAVWNLGIETRATLFGLSLVSGIIWTIYFKFAMVDRFVDHPKLIEAIREEEEAD